MKTFIISLLVAAVLAISTPQIHAPEPAPQPQVITCIMTWCAIGIFALCVVACEYHVWNSDYSGPTNSPPIVQMPTNSIVTNVPPEFSVDAMAQTQHFDASPYHWLDSGSNEVTDVYRTTIQTSSSPAGPWTNAYVVTLWQSAYGSTALVEDGAGTALATNYSRRSGNGSVTNYAPLELAHDQPQRFYRAKP